MADTSKLTIHETPDFTHSVLQCLAYVGRQHGITLTLQQLVRDHRIIHDEVTKEQVLDCARGSGLQAKAVRLNWAGLARLGKALPVILRFKNGTAMVLERVEDDPQVPRAYVKDPNSAGDLDLVLDRERFEEAWTGDVILVKRDYDLADETKPFQLRLDRHAGVPGAAHRARRGDLCRS